MKYNLQLAALFLLASVAMAAQESAPRVYRSGNEWIEESTGTLTAIKSLRVKTSAGSIQIQGNPQNTITYVVRKRMRASSEENARREFARLRVSASNTPEGSVIRGEGEHYSKCSIDFDIRVPNPISSVKLETTGGAVTATNIQGPVEAATGGGVIHLDQIGAGVSATSGGGDIEIGKVGGDVYVQTGGGGIRIGSAGGKIVAMSGGGTLIIGSGQAMTLQTGGGSIQVDKCTGAVKASTGGGTVNLNEVTGHAQVSSGGGSIKVVHVAGGLRAETGSGPIIADLSAGHGTFTESRLETAAGDIIVYIPDDLAITIRAAVDVAHGAGISSEFPGLKISANGQQWGPRELWAEGSLNGGGPVLHVHAITGSITLKRKEKK